MRIRAAFVSAGLMAAMAMATVGGAGCTHASANVPVDSPKLLPYQAPDIDEITGIDSEDADAAEKPATPPPAAEKPASQAQKPHH
jgi:hypothetical protein